MTNAVELGQRLARRREEFGVSTGTVANWASLPEHRIESAERGDALEPWALRQVCQALAVNPGTILRGEEQSPRRSVARFRAAVAPGPPSPTDLRVLAVGAEIGRILGSLVELLSVTYRITKLRRPVAPTDVGMLWRQGYQLGELARSQSGVSSDPIPDVENSMMTLGIHVGRAEFSSEDIDAASLWEVGSLPVILLNVRSPRVRYLLSRRAILAHELCHLLHDAGEADLTTQVSWADGSGRRADLIEQRARAFAPAFLAPRDSVRQWARTVVRQTTAPKLIERLARHWGFSKHGAIWHAKNCRLISSRIADELYQDRSATERLWMSDFEGGRTGDATVALAVSSELLDRVSSLWAGLGAQLVARAYEAGAISAGRAREIFGWR